MAPRSTVQFSATKLSGKALQAILGISSPTRQDWTSKGMPRNEDESYSAPDCIKWLRDQDEAARPSPATNTDEADLIRLRGEKLRKDISLMDLDLQEKLRGTMLRSEHAQAIADRATLWQTMVAQTLPRQAHMFLDLKTPEQARARLHELAVVFADCWRLTPAQLKEIGYTVDDDGVTHSPAKETDHV